MRVGAVDCGTNSIKLLVADLDPATGQQSDIHRTLRIVRLGQGVDHSGRLAPEAVVRTLAAAAEYAALLRSLGIDRLAVAATSATREASNGAEVVTGLAERLGVVPRVLSGVDEARLSYAGAVRGLGALAQAELLLVDIGGGSTELVRGHGPDVTAAASVDLGSVRLTERHLAGDPPTPAQTSAAVADVEAGLDGLEVPVTGAEVVVVVGGTGLTVTAHALGLDTLDPQRLHGANLAADAVRASCAALLAATVAERRDLAVMHPGRADVIGGGALVLDRILARVGAAAVVASNQDVLDGLAWSLVNPPDAAASG